MLTISNLNSSLGWAQLGQDRLSAVVILLDQRGHFLGVVGGVVADVLVLEGAEAFDGTVDHGGGEDAVLFVEGAVLLEAVGRFVAGGGELFKGVEELLVLLVVDVHVDVGPVGDFEGVGFIKQNDSELGAFVGRELNDVTDLISAGTKLLAKLNVHGVLITRGEMGMTLFERHGATHHIPVSDMSEVYDVSGAGDTCVAAFLLALTAGAQPSVAAKISNYAAGLAVRKMGTSTVSATELIAALERAR